ncbi:hypothetical protein A2U01_0063799, partial [Trifolium medium]|nr:hypothetical protein [Trifolium medium]
MQNPVLGFGQELKGYQKWEYKFFQVTCDLDAYDASQSQVEAVIDASQSFLDEIPDEVMAIVPEINPDDIPK